MSRSTALLSMCGRCGVADNDDYAAMWQAIEASGRAMVLTVEGNPDDSLITKGGYGNAKRVGHDISPHWMSMVSLVDIASGLWMYAHNSTNGTFGGWWNDLDMVRRVGVSLRARHGGSSRVMLRDMCARVEQIEVGNSPDFDCGADAPSLLRCQAHFTQWCIMKAPLILGSNLPVIDATTLSGTWAACECVGQ